MAGSRPLDLEELMILTAIAPTTRERALLMLLAGSGLRINEIRSAVLASIQHPDGKITGRIHITRSNTKGKNASRLISLPQPTIDALTEWLLDHPQQDRAAPLFPSSHDPTQPLTTRQLQRIITAAAKRAGLQGKVTAHSFRKYFAQTMYKALGNDINLTARCLNHKDPKSTMYYLDEGADAINRATASAIPPTLKVI